MRTSDLAIIFFCLLLILVGLYLYSSVTGISSEREGSLRYSYSTLCQDAFSRPVLSERQFLYAHSGTVNISVSDWQIVFSCVDVFGNVFVNGSRSDSIALNTSLLT